jgi:hypothetical protein
MTRCARSASLLLLAALAFQPPMPLGAQPQEAPPRSALRRLQPHTSYLGVWALSDDRNNLFNVRLSPDGRAVSTVGTAGVPVAGAQRLRADQLRQQGRWRPWGNGVRIDYADGWTDWIYVGPSGLAHASWTPGQDRASIPCNHGEAVHLSDAEAAAVGVYRLPPAQADLPPYTATLLSNGLAFNDIDARAGGVWQRQGAAVTIDWISGWRTVLQLEGPSALQVRHWAPGADRQGPPTAIRQAERLD